MDHACSTQSRSVARAGMWSRSNSRAPSGIFVGFFFGGGGGELTGKGGGE